MNQPIYKVKEPLTIEEFLEFYENNDNGLRYELINGFIHMMAPPNTIHQALSMFLSGELYNFLKGKKCRAFAAPYGVFLKTNVDNEETGKILKMKKNISTNTKKKWSYGTYVEPDLMVICDNKKIKPDGCHGAPDFIIEILSPSNSEEDRTPKLYSYLLNGVREYWIVNPYTDPGISVCKFNEELKKMEINIFTFGDIVKSHVLEGLEIDFSQIKSVLN